MLQEQKYDSSIQDNNAQISETNERKVVELQDLLQLYESLELRNEYQATIREYFMLLFQTGDLSKIKDLLVKFNMIEHIKKNNKSTVNEQESITNMLACLDGDICRTNNIDPEYIASIVSQKKAKSKVIIQAQKKICGIDRVDLFKKSILPCIQTLCERASLNIVEAITQIIMSICEAEKQEANSGGEAEILNQIQQLQMMKHFSDKKDQENFHQFIESQIGQNPVDLNQLQNLQNFNQMNQQNTFEINQMMQQEDWVTQFQQKQQQSEFLQPENLVAMKGNQLMTSVDVPPMV